MSNQSPSQTPISSDFKKLFTKKWVIFTLLVILAIGISIRAGFWQYSRHQDRVLTNKNIEQALASEFSILDTTNQTYQPWQKVIAEGTFDATSQRLVRRKYFEGQLGFYVVTKFTSMNGETFLVNRGFTPVVGGANESPIVSAPASGVQKIEGYLVPLDPPRARASDLPQMQVSAINREQFDIQESFDFYLNLIAPPGELSPIAPPQPTYGPHLAYSLQWFTFAIMIMIGWIVLTRRDLKESN